MPMTGVGAVGVPKGGRLPRRVTLALVVLALVVLAMCAAGWRIATEVRSFAPIRVGAVVDSTAKGRITAGFIPADAGVHTHAPSLVEMRDGRVRAFWWQGTREGAQDVSIRTAVFDPVAGQWQAQATVVDRAAVQAGVGRYVRKLGNAVASYAADGTLRLFFVSVSVGGWGGSAINTMTSADDGETWSPPRRLVTSPFLNVSTLVRGAPYLHADGGLTVPAYHEFIGKFAEVVRLDASGRIVDKQRLTRGDLALQPTMLVRDPKNVVALMRNGSSEIPRRVVRVDSDDAGAHWSRPSRTVLPNSDAPLAGVALPGGRLVIVLNQLESNRNALSLAVSDDAGLTWREVHRFEDQSHATAAPPDPKRFRQLLAAAVADDAEASGGLVESSVRQMCRGDVCDFEFSYPFLIRTAAGEFFLAYTWNRSRIRMARFDEAWLAERATAGAPG